MNWESVNHPLYVGWVIGIARRNGVHLTPVVDEHGDYTDRATLEAPPTPSSSTTSSVTISHRCDRP
jgi:hypothetical protein